MRSLPRSITSAIRRETISQFSSSANFDRLTKTGVSVLASFVTETHPNTFPRLPVRENANVFVWFARFLDREAYEKPAAAIREKETALKLPALMVEQPEILILSPTARSLL
jgi:hypothetical protein